MMYLFDTNIISYVLKQHPIAARYQAELEQLPHAVSGMTMSELLVWAEINPWNTEQVTKAINDYLEAAQVLPLSAPICRFWADIRLQRRFAGRPISVEDAFIAATALHHNLPLVTHNAKDFAEIEQLAIISYPD